MPPLKAHKKRCAEQRLGVRLVEKVRSGRLCQRVENGGKCDEVLKLKFSNACVVKAAPALNASL